MKIGTIKFVDCTLRDGGYYNDWDFSPVLISDYLKAMASVKVDFVEIGFRSLNNKGFKGGCAFSTDHYINSLPIPKELKNKIGVMVNGSELIPKFESMFQPDSNTIAEFQQTVLKKLFTSKDQSPVTLVRIACHVDEFEHCLPASNWLKKRGYLVGFNIMQVADRTLEEIKNLALKANQHPIDTLYFADSMGSLDPAQTKKIIEAFYQGWEGGLGIHTHDNMGQALANTLSAIKDGVTWVDSTVTGMGRGAGNAQTEYLAIALADFRKQNIDMTKLFEVIRKHFKNMQAKYGWGTNPYYYLTGKYGIHPSYVQEMLSDSRYSDEDILSVIDHLKKNGGKKFSLDILETARHFYSGVANGNWTPATDIGGKEVLILGTGPGIIDHKVAVEAYIERQNPYVIGLNAEQSIEPALINIRAACHPVRLLADCHEHLKFNEPLVTPASMLPPDLKEELGQKKLLDYGISIESEVFEFFDNRCVIPSSLVINYALAIAASGKAKKILLAGFDGYGADDPRRKEIDNIFKLYSSAQQSIPFVSITPTRYEIPIQSIYGL
jgi:4-hydroxy 2-oxovalerate aldolase